MANGTETRHLGRYELLFMLGQGGMGEVHLAKLSGAAGFEKLCIVKTILPQVKADPQFVERFHHEARVLVQLTHSSIAQVYDMGDVDETLYMAIEYVPGVDLARVESRTLAHGHVVPIPIALYVGRHVAEALGYAHRKAGPDGAPLSIVHRDVSPQNVMVSYEGEVKVIDFGLAKSAARSQHTLPATVMGKLGYMAPEQAMAMPVDSRGDIYSAGIVIWEMLAGRRMFGNGTMPEMVMMMANPTIPSLRSVRPDVSPAIENAVMRALHKEPAQRYQRAEDFAKALNELSVRENASVSAEEVGNFVRSVCPEEFAAERQLQSQLSLLRKKGSSPSLAKATQKAEIEGTFLRPSSPGEHMTPAQRALSVVATPSHSAATLEDQPQPSLSIPKSRAPMIVAVLAGLVLAGGVGAYFITSSSRVEPVPQVPDVAKPPEIAKLPTVENTPLDAAVAVAEVVPPGAAKAEPKALALIDVTAPIFNVRHEDGKRYILLKKGQGLSQGDRLKLIGEPVGGKRPLFGTAVLSVTGSLATVILDDDVALPDTLFAVRDASPRPAVAKNDRRPPDKTDKPDKPGTKLQEDQLVAWPAQQKPPDQPLPTEPPAVTAPPAYVATASPNQANPNPTPAPVPPQAKGVELSGKLEIFKPIIGGKRVRFYNSNRFMLSACEIRLPNGRTHRFANRELLGRNETWAGPLAEFYPDNRPADPRFAQNYALLTCREGTGALKVVGEPD